MFYTHPVVSSPHFIPRVCFIPSPQSMVRSLHYFYTDRFLIILVMLVILVIQVIIIFLEITIDPYQCCQSYLKSSKICSQVAIKISSRGTICYMNNYNQPSILVIPLKRYLSESWKKFCLKWMIMNSRD